jgi:hypothetical protein
MALIGVNAARIDVGRIDRAELIEVDAAISIEVNWHESREPMSVVQSHTRRQGFVEASVQIAQGAIFLTESEPVTRTRL